MIRILYLFNIWVGIRKGDRIKDRQTLVKFVGNNFDFKISNWPQVLGTLMLSSTYLDIAPCYKAITSLTETTESFILYEVVRIGNPQLFFKLLFHDFLQLALITKNYIQIARMNNFGLDVALIPYQYRTQNGLTISDKHRDELLAATNNATSGELFSLVNVISLFEIDTELLLKTLKPYLELPLINENLALIGTVLECCSVKSNDDLESLYEKAIGSYLPSNLENVNLLRGFLRLVVSLPKHYLTLDKLTSVYKLLETNVSSFNPEVRRTTLEIFLKYQQPLFPQSNTVYTGPSTVQIFNRL